MPIELKIVNPQLIAYLDKQGNVISIGDYFQVTN